MTRDEMIDGTIAEMRKYGEGTTLGELIRIKIREGEQWAARSWAEGLSRRGPLYRGIASHETWAQLLLMAGKYHSDWTFRPNRDGEDIYVRPLKRAVIRRRNDLVAWFVLNHTDLAFALEDDAWNAVDA